MFAEKDLTGLYYAKLLRVQIYLKGDNISLVKRLLQAILEVVKELYAALA